jgi:hypothetical protein
MLFSSNAPGVGGTIGVLVVPVVDVVPGLVEQELSVVGVVVPVVEVVSVVDVVPMVGVVPAVDVVPVVCVGLVSDAV